ncbi:Fur-regulated basic protein FbpA [Bacillus toyonensis]|uniref:Fur-regulated basic protein FbpA n=1 Tax=Bacillus toyonensis TaxID=155322 RepID=UPI00115E9619|nr:Fur-regulated basic protein FbpA [Bacillus toyonensis]
MKQDVLINKLIDNHIYKLPDGRDLFEGSFQLQCFQVERNWLDSSLENLRKN